MHKKINLIAGLVLSRWPQQLRGRLIHRRRKGQLS